MALWKRCCIFVTDSNMSKKKNTKESKPQDKKKKVQGSKLQTKNQKPVKKKLYRNKYHAMLNVFGYSLLISLLWGMTRWVWVKSGVMPLSGNHIVPLFIIPILLTALHLLLCGHYIRAIHDKVEMIAWYTLPILSLLLFCSVGEYAEMRALSNNDYHHSFDETGKLLAIIWQIVLSVEAAMLFFIYRSYYVAKEYQESYGRTKGKLEKIQSHSKLIGNFLVFVLIPLVMVVLFVLILFDGYEFGGENGLLLVEWGSLHYSLVIERGEWWRLITHAFLHGGVSHLLSNLAMYYVCAIFLRKVGVWRTFVVFMLSCIASGACVLIFSEHNTVGASGGIFGLLTYWLIYEIRTSTNEDGTFNDDAKFPAQMLGYNIAYSFGSGISTSGHFGGLFAGLALGSIANLWPIVTWTLTALITLLLSVYVYSHRYGILNIHKQRTEMRK